MGCMILLRAVAAIAVHLISAASYASGEYDFCIDCASPAKREVLHVHFKYDDIDPGKEIARA